MENLLAVIIGVLFGGATFMLLRRSMVKIIIGLALLAHGANLLLFTIGKIQREAAAPIIDASSAQLDGTFTDPVPQALILTAIVIGFGAQAFAIVLIKRVYQLLDTDDMDEMQTADH
jgi:multicomponent Na+:H+ antiporter subunit C